jgi:SulP family sulfate permease
MVDLTVAVQVGLVLACVFFIYRISSLTTIERLAPAGLPEGVDAYAMIGALFFGAVGKLETLVDSSSMPRRALVLDLQRLLNMDATGLDALEGVQRALARHGSQLVLCGVHGQPRSIMARSGFLQRLGQENCVVTLEQALARYAESATTVTAPGFRA